MRAVVVYEPALATTRLVAQAVAIGLDRSVSVVVLPSTAVETTLLGHADLLRRRYSGAAGSGDSTCPGATLRDGPIEKSRR